MDSPLIRRLSEREARFVELQNALNDPAVLANPPRLIAASKEAGQLESVVSRFREFKSAQTQLHELRELAAGSDAEMAELAKLELSDADEKMNRLLEDLKDLFVAAEDNAVDSFFLEIRAGTGGEEAALFGRDFFEMYRKYCEAKGWKFEVSDFSTSDRNGLKEVIINIKGSGAYRHFQFEGGGHRVQRVPETEAFQGRRSSYQPPQQSRCCPKSTGHQNRHQSQRRRRIRLPRRGPRRTKRQQSRNRLAALPQAHRHPLQNDRAQIPSPKQGARLGAAPRQPLRHRARQAARRPDGREKR